MTLETCQQNLALGIGKKLKREDLICAASGNLGKVLMQQGSYEEALEQFVTAHALAKGRSRIVQVRAACGVVVVCWQLDELMLRWLQTQRLLPPVPHRRGIRRPCS